MFDILAAVHLDPGAYETLGALMGEGLRKAGEFRHFEELHRGGSWLLWGW